MATTQTRQQQQVTTVTTPTSLTVSSQSDPALQSLLTGVWGESPSYVPLLALYFPSTSCSSRHHHEEQVKALFKRQQQQQQQPNSNSRSRNFEKRLFDLVYVPTVSPPPLDSDDSTTETGEEKQGKEIFLQNNLVEENDGWLYVPSTANKEQRIINIRRHFGVGSGKEEEEESTNNDPALIIVDKQRDVVLTTTGIEDIMKYEEQEQDGNGDGSSNVVDPLTKWRHLLSESNLED